MFALFTFLGLDGKFSGAATESLCSPKPCKSFKFLEKSGENSELLDDAFQMDPTLMTISGDLSVYL